MSVVSLGELLIDFVALESGVTVGEASGFIKAPGGAPANVVVALARLGHASAFLTQVGDDPFGHHLAQVLADEGVDVRGIRFSQEARTTLAFVSLAEGGERSFVFYRHPGADMLMTPADVDMARIDGQRIFHYGSITMIADSSRAALQVAIERALARGLTLSYDPNLRLALWPDAASARHWMLAGLEYAHVVKVSDEEVDFLCEGAVEALWRERTQLLIVTHGPGGATLYTRDERLHMPGFAVDSVDTTGAGDGFVAAVLASLLEHGDDWPGELRGMLRFANAVGALTTTVRGAIPGLPRRAAVEAFLMDRGEAE